MPAYKFTGYNQSGTESSGTIEADSLRSAALKIKAKGILPGDITEAEAPAGNGLFKKVTQSELAGITRNLSTLISSGVPLVDAINAISSEQKAGWKHVLLQLKEGLASGASLSRSMQAHPEVFPDFYTGLITAGENSGKLTEVMEKLADFLEGDISIKSKVKTALMYPIFMAGISILIILFLFTFVIPRITRIFEDTSAALPFITLILLWVSTTFQKFWWLILAGFAAASLTLRRLKNNNREFIDSMLLKDPSGILMGLYMLRFTMTMGFLLSGGMPILNSMQLTAKSTGNAALEKKIMNAHKMVSQGSKLSTSLEGFPPTLLQIISTGEQTGRLPEIL
ncbi:type II secretion system F family protein, partial [bacterium]|nr:type II secretion system F family protein [bacterium]